jgi:chromosome segregation ATPase
MKASPNPKIEDLQSAKARLGERLRQINEEIRGYPQPIARCDSQLGGLVEERAQIQAQLGEIEERLAGSDRRLR